MPKPLHLLTDLANFGVEKRLSLRDPQFRAAFAEHVSAGIERALADPIMLHGHRVEAMFEALLLALGDFTLLKAEDGPPVYPEGRFKLPDFRVVLADGAQWLIEVKNVYEPDPLNQRRLLMRRDYREALQAYAAATGATLKLAVYWARWQLWTLVSPEHFLDAQGDLTLDMMTAVPANELARLGDRTIGTTAPLRLHLLADPARTGPIGDDGTVTITFGGTCFLCDGAEITDPLEKEIASTFMEYGDWECDGPFAVIEDGRLHAVEFRWDPIEPTGQGFEIIGSLSRMFARDFAARTVDADAVVQLRAPLRPDWFAPLVQPGHVCKALPLWRFSLQPSHAEPDAPVAVTA